MKMFWYGFMVRVALLLAATSMTAGIADNTRNNTSYRFYYVPTLVAQTTPYSLSMSLYQLRDSIAPNMNPWVYFGISVVSVMFCSALLNAYTIQGLTLQIYLLCTYLNNSLEVVDEHEAHLLLKAKPGTLSHRLCSNKWLSHTYWALLKRIVTNAIITCVKIQKYGSDNEVEDPLLSLKALLLHKELKKYERALENTIMLHHMHKQTLHTDNAHVMINVSF